jgi:hypothetical protein
MSRTKLYPTKDNLIKADVYNICCEHMSIYPEWKGLPVIPTKSALDELIKYYMDLEDVVRILELGYEFTKRRKGTVEKCLNRKGEVIKVVVVQSYNYSLKTDCWVVKHIGIYKR